MNSQMLFIFAVVAIATAVIATPVNKDTPDFSCPEGEMYEKCSQIHCYKNCGHLKSPPACPSVSADCYKPACECEGDTLRNADGICIPLKMCPEYNPAQLALPSQTS